MKERFAAIHIAHGGSLSYCVIVSFGHSEVAGSHEPTVIFLFTMHFYRKFQSQHTHTHKTQLRKKGIRKMKLEFCARNEFVTFRFLSERSGLCKFYLWFHSVSIVSSISRLRACFFVPLVWWIAWNARISLEINSNKGEMPQHLRQNETKSTNRKICILHELRTVIRTLCIHMHNDL